MWFGKKTYIYVIILKKNNCFVVDSCVSVPVDVFYLSSGGSRRRVPGVHTPLWFCQFFQITRFSTRKPWKCRILHHFAHRASGGLERPPVPLPKKTSRDPDISSTPLSFEAASAPAKNHANPANGDKGIVFVRSIKIWNSFQYVILMILGPIKSHWRLGKWSYIVISAQQKWRENCFDKKLHFPNLQ